MFITRFFIGNISIVILAAIVVLLKKLLKDKITPKFHYYIWSALLLSLIVVLIPNRHMFSAKVNFIAQKITSPTINTLSPSDMPSDWRYEFTEVIDSFNSISSMPIIIIIWVIGALTVIGFYCLGHRKLRMIIHFSEEPSEDIIKIFDDCRKQISVKNNIHLLQSRLVTAPLTFGCKTIYVALPEDMTEKSSQTNIEHILLHELIHIKHRDTWVNFLFCAEQLVYWFNPIVWWAFSQMRRDREVYCDWAVLNIYPTEEERLCYGETLIQSAGKKNSSIIYTANGLFFGKTQIKYRIERIANYKRETRCSQALGRILLVGLSFAVFVQNGVLSAFASDFGLSYQPNQTINITEADYSDLFNEITGCAVIFDTRSNSYLAYNVPMITKRVAPCSTCKIYSAINALEHGFITPKNNTLMWDNINREFPEWNNDQTLRTAIRNSANWYFQALDRHSGADLLEQFYNGIGYGNGCIGNDTAYYWNGSSLRISPLEQTELLVKLYNNEFLFKEDNLDAVKDALYISDYTGNRLYGKTGTGKKDNNDIIGWFVGYVETDNNTYFITVSLQDEANANGKNAAQIAYQICEKLGIQLY